MTSVGTWGSSEAAFPPKEAIITPRECRDLDPWKSHLRRGFVLFLRAVIDVCSAQHTRGFALGGAVLQRGVGRDDEKGSSCRWILLGMGWELLGQGPTEGAETQSLEIITKP